jgi:hypothetical protein
MSDSPKIGLAGEERARPIVEANRVWGTPCRAFIKTDRSSINGYYTTTKLKIVQCLF